MFNLQSIIRRDISCSQWGISDNSISNRHSDPAPEYNDACSPPGLGGVRNDMGAYGGPGNSGWPLVVDDYWIKNFILKAYYPSDEFKLKLDINGDSIIDSSDIIEYVNHPKREE